MIERDYLMRMISQLSAVLARILFAKNAQNYAEALRITQNAYDQLFGLNGELVKHLDAATLARLLGDKEKIKALAGLLREEGEILHLQNQPAAGNEKFGKALALYQEALRLTTSAEPDCQQAIFELQAKLANAEPDAYI